MGLFRQLNDYFGFGFGLVDNWAMMMSFGSAIMGTGFGMYIVAHLFLVPRRPSYGVVVVGTIITVFGAVITEIAHRKLKRKARDLRERRT